MSHELNLWGTPAAAPDFPGLHTKAARRVKDALDWFARSSGDCWARLDTIAARAGVAVRTAQKWLRLFARWGMIEVQRRGRRSAVRSVLGAPCALACALKGPETICTKKTLNKDHGAADGVCARPPAPTQATEPGNPPPRPALPHLDARTLGTPSKMGELLGAFLASHGLCEPERARDPRTLLRWFGLARRARRVGRNPGGLFRTLLAGKRWGWISQQDEDAARLDVAAFLHGQERRRRETPALAEVLD